MLLKVRPGTSLDRAAVARLVSRSAEDLDEGRVAVEVFEGRGHTVAGSAFRKVGPVFVIPGSEWPLRAMLSAAALVITGLLAALAVTTVKLRKAGPLTRDAQ